MGRASGFFCTGFSDLMYCLILAKVDPSLDISLSTHRGPLLIKVYIIGKKKTTYVYKTADELIAKGSAKRKSGKDSGSSKPSKHSQVKVIDMTGKEQRVLSGM